jgi:hypothetical protein
MAGKSNGHNSGFSIIKNIHESGDVPHCLTAHQTCVSFL